MLVAAEAASEVSAFAARMSAADAPVDAFLTLALIVVLALLGAVLYFSSAIGHHMSLTLRVIMTRLMGMILAAISIGMLATGLKDLLPGLAG